MKYSYLLLIVFINSLLTSCNYNRRQEMQYSIYSSLLDKEFGHSLDSKPSIIIVNDTIKDFKDELRTLIYSIKNNNKFFTEYCHSDSSFKDFILSIKFLAEEKEMMNIEKLRTMTKMSISLHKSTEHELQHHTISLSKIILNRDQDKAVLFVTTRSSGFWIFAELINEKWTVRHELLAWIT